MKFEDSAECEKKNQEGIVCETTCMDSECDALILDSVQLEPIQTEFQAIVEVPETQYVNKLIEVPEIEYVDVPIEVVNEVPRVVIEEIVQDIRLPLYKSRPVPRVVTKHVPFKIDRYIPDPVEAEISCEVEMKHQDGSNQDENHEYEIYLPRFIEVPVPAELLSSEEFANINELRKEFMSYTDGTKTSTTESITHLVSNLENLNVNNLLEDSEVKTRIETAIASGTVVIN